MTESYIIYIQTELPANAVLETIFEPKTITPLDGTNLLIARGLVYLAHAQPLPPQMQERHAPQFGFAPTLSIRFFPDGVSSVSTAMDMLVDGLNHWFIDTTDNLLLTANKTEILKRIDEYLTIKTQHRLWTTSRLNKIDCPYEELR